MKRSCARRTRTAELIPGLPDCLAVECLLHLPFHAILDARAVCKRWKHELDSPSFYRIRRDAGLASRVVSLLLRGKLPHTVDKFHLAIYEPDTGVCTMRQLALNRPIMREQASYRVDVNMGSSDAAFIGRELVVIGGWDVSENRRTGEVHIYDLHSGAWRSGAPNPAPERLFCRYVLNGEKVLVVGGRDKKGKKLRSMLGYDVAADTWLEMPDLGEDTCQETSIDDGTFCSFCDKFWRSREEYNNAIQRCRKLLLVDDEKDLRLYPTKKEKEKEIFMSVPKDNKSDEDKSVTLNEGALRTLRQRLGILPNEIGFYLESYYSGRL